MIITIARQCGCGALNVGRLLSEKFGIPLYSRRNLLEMARKEGFLDLMNDFFEERPVNDLLYAISSSFTEDRQRVTEKSLKVLAGMIGAQPCIIVGRCGNYIFRHRSDLVSVFLHGSLSARIDGTMSERGCRRSEAEEFVDLTDNCRKVYHNFYTGLTWGNASDYDLCLNSTSLGAEGTARIIEQYCRQAQKL